MISTTRKTLPADNQLSDSQSQYVSPGMPPLAKNGRIRSIFEFWPNWLIYAPVTFQWLYLSLKYRSLTLPLIANPGIRLSGMVGVPKSELLAQASGQCAESILPWFIHQINDETKEQQAKSVMQQMQLKNLHFPLVCKPDIGCRGSGVKLVKNNQQLEEYLAAYPTGSSIMLQKLASYEAEAGLFFVRYPNQPSGKIISLALKYMPYVIGDGKKTLKELIDQDERASQLAHLYHQRHKHKLDEIIPAGKSYRLIFSASHCRGAVFKNAEHLITPELTQTINDICAQIPEFYYGRMDIKFADVEQLKHGRSIEIVEINTASSESLHIWDSDTKYRDAMKALFFQYRTLFTIGQQNKQRGYSPPGIIRFYKHWLTEMRLKKFYPETD